MYYQEGKPDEFIYEYSYDKDNRLVEARSSANGIIWDTDAKYYYYKHGPLARIEKGTHKVQSEDYAYNIQGWQKGMNSGTLDHNRDMGKDSRSGYNSSLPQLHAQTARDAAGYTLGYYENDYLAISQPTAAADFEPTNAVYAPGTQKYNGVIQHTVTAIQGLNNPILAKTFDYDDLYRIKSMKAHNITASTNAWDQTALNDYKEAYTYDKNGNIKTLLRKGITSIQLDMDSIEYTYLLGKNILDMVTDMAADHLDYNDIKNGNSTFVYDEKGRLIQDNKEGITISWTPYDKIKKISKTGTDIEFKYDASGNRICKVFILNGVAINYTYYLRDASGNVISTYERQIESDATYKDEKFKWGEQHLYGAARLGLKEMHHLLVEEVGPLAGPTLTIYKGPEPERNLNTTLYELSNHLGNVISVVTAKKLPQSDIAATHTFTASADGWTGVLTGVAAQLNNELEITTTVANDGAKSPGIAVIAGEIYTLSFDLSNNNTTVQIEVKDILSSNVLLTALENSSGFKTYTYTAIGNTMEIVALRTNLGSTFMKFYIDNVNMSNNYYLADVVSAQDYYSFGMLMPGRTYNSNRYRYGFNGMEKFDKMYSMAGAFYLTYFRGYDPRLGRWISPDPVFQPWQSPYAAMDNNPVSLLTLMVIMQLVLL